MFYTNYIVYQSSRRDILILFTALFNRNTPKMIKTMTIVAFLYLISPIDFLPDMIPGLGLLDDAVCCARNFICYASDVTCFCQSKIRSTGRLFRAENALAFSLFVEFFS